MSMKWGQLSTQQRSAILAELFPNLLSKMKSADEVAEIREVGRHRVAPRLYLNVDRRGNRSWLFRYMHDGKAREMGLGSYPKVSYAEAVRRVQELRATFFDPVAVRYEAVRRRRAEEHVPAVAAWLPSSDRGRRERRMSVRTKERLVRELKRHGIEFDPNDL